jgi:hypothetical protein
MSIDVIEKLHREPPRVDPARDVAGGGPDHLSVLVGLAAVVFSAVYFLSDLIEDAQHGFSNSQLVLTYVAEAAIPLFVIGLYAVAASADRAARSRRRDRVFVRLHLLHGHGDARSGGPHTRLKRPR